jgi:hypothetical protein
VKNKKKCTYANLVDSLRSASAADGRAAEVDAGNVETRQVRERDGAKQAGKISLALVHNEFPTPPGFQRDEEVKRCKGAGTRD